MASHAASGPANGAIVEVDVGCATIHLTGEIDADSDHVLTDAFERVSPETDSILVDMRDVTFIDSAGLRTLLSGHQSLTDRGVLVAIRPSEIVTRLLEITGLNSVLTLSDNAQTNGGRP